MNIYLDKVRKEVDHGGYDVHPVPPPNTEIEELTLNRYESNRITTEHALTAGCTTSGDPGDP